VKLARSTVKSLGHNLFALAGIYCVILVSGCGGGGSTPPPPPTVNVSVSPKRAAITTGQTQSFAATVTGSSNTSVTWGVDTIAGGNATVGTIDASGKYTPPTSGGAHTVTATSVADGAKSASASLGVTDLAGVFTYHNNISRDGSNIKEYALTPANVSTSTFGKLFSCAVDGAIYAQPLWAGNVTIGGAKHNIIFVATMHDSVYAFDADTSPCVTLWHANLIDAAHGGAAGETAVTATLLGSGFGDIRPEIGITSTPVIDPSTNTLYAVSKSTVTGAAFFQRLHALDLTAGTERLNGNKPMLIAASVPGTGDGSSGGSVAFDPGQEGQRPGLALLSNGVVYVAWASHEDSNPYHGWVMGFDKTSLNRVSVFNSSPNGRQGGIWMSGGAPAADAASNLYVITGNGNYNGITDFGDSILKLSGGLSLLDSFTPSVQANLDINDGDLGSGGVLLVDSPSAPTGFQRLLVGGGKGPYPALNGVLYVANRDNLGMYNPSDSGIVQEFPIGGMDYATPAFWQNNLYIAGVGQSLMSFSFTPSLGQFNATPSSQSAANFAFPGATPSVSSNGSSNGIVWVLDTSQYCTPQSPGCQPAVLHAYDATNVHSELWNSSQVASDAAGFAVKFTVPTVANGKVYIGTRGNDTGSGTSSVLGDLDVYGLKPN
jgi:hypothetical protein